MEILFLISNGYEPKRSRIRMFCSRFRQFRRCGNKKRITYSTLPTDRLGTCTFTFSLLWRDNKWQIKNGNGNRHHCNHYKLSAPDILRGTTTIPQVEREFLKSIANTNASSAVVTTVLLERTGQCLTSSASQYLMNSFKEKKDYINSCDDKDKNSAALQLITFLKSQTNVTFVALWDNPESNLFCLRKSCGKDKEIYEYNCKLILESHGKSEELNSEVIDPSGEFKHYLESTRKSFCLPKTERLLLGCVWTTDDLHRRMSLYPEVLAMDVLEKTNRQRRSLFVVAGKDAQNKVFPALYAYMPSHAG